MRKPITIAMLISVAMHVAVFMLLERLLGERAELSEATELPVISVQSLNKEYSGRNDAAPVERAPAKTRRHNVPAPQKAADARAPEPDRSGPNRTAAKTNRRPAAGLRQASTRTAESAISHDSGISTPEVVTSNANGTPFTVAGDSRNEPPTFATAELSRRQEKMLRRKLKDWAEDLQHMSTNDRPETWIHDDQKYVAEFVRDKPDDDMQIERVTVIVSTEDSGETLSTEIQLKRLAFSSYAQFVNRWDKNVQIHDDELDGRFHSNSQIYLSYSRKARPQFRGEVTTSARSVSFAERRGYIPRNKIFLAGLQTGVKTIRLPKHYAPFLPEEDEVGDDVAFFEQDTRITFYEDGTFAWQAIQSDAFQGLSPISANTHFLVAADDVALHVSGTVNGKVLVYSPEKIVIEGNLLYAANPEYVDTADDFLGLASGKNVEIAPPDITGPGDLAIFAAIYAKRRFSVRRYRSRGPSLLHIYGSLTAGTLSATEPRFATKIQFDQRLENLRPPRFPMTDRYAVESWSPEWRVESTADGSRQAAHSSRLN